MTSNSTMRHDETTVTVAGEPVRCYRAGGDARPTLVLLHGDAPGSAQHAWAPLWGTLTPHARLVAPDLPGYGGSPLGTTQPTLQGYLGWLLGFLDACRIRHATIGGLHFGGGIALHTALEAPGRVEGLALLAPCGPSPMPAGGRAASPRGASWPVPGASRGELARIGCPALLLSGERDELVPPEKVRQAAGWIPGARFTLVPDAGHWLPGEAPDRVAEELVACLARASAATGNR